MQVLFCNPRISFTGIYQRERMCSQPANSVDEVARTLVIGLGARGYINDRSSCATGWLTVVLYSLRNTFIGSTFVARRAGRKQATSEMHINKSVMAANVSGSTGLMPKSISRRRRVEAKAAINPSAMPMSVNFIPRLRTRLSTSLGRAPSAIRMPSSCLRCVTA